MKKVNQLKRENMKEIMLLNIKNLKDAIGKCFIIKEEYHQSIKA